VTGLGKIDRKALRSIKASDFNDFAEDSVAIAVSARSRLQHRLIAVGATVDSCARTY